MNENDKKTETKLSQGLVTTGVVLTIFLVFAIGLSLIPQRVFAQPAPQPRIVTQDQSAFQGLQQVYRFILNNYVDEVDQKKLIEGAFKGMFEALEDPYSVYLGASDMRELTDTTSGEFGGIGAYIEKERNADGSTKTDGFIEIAAPIEDTPAYKADLRSGDMIISIDDKTTTDMIIDTAVKNLRGKPDTNVSLRIRRGLGEPFTIVITRKVIQVPTYKQAMIDDIAYIRLIQFTPHTAENFEAAFRTLIAKKPRGLIIDLRNNPGGVLDAPLDIADLFLDDGLILSTKGRMTGENQEFKAAKGKLAPEQFPIIILTNGGSASASEILAGALRDRGRAILVGETTFGKGLVQRVIPISTVEGFKLTTSRYYTPSGVTIDKVGIAPTLEIKEPELSPTEEKALLTLREKNMVANFVDTNPKPLAADLKKFLNTLVAQGLDVNERYLNRLVKLEVERRANIQSVYDLDFDVQLKKAIELFDRYPELLAESIKKTAIASEATKLAESEKQKKAAADTDLVVPSTK